MYWGPSIEERFGLRNEEFESGHSRGGIGRGSGWLLGQDRGGFEGRSVLELDGQRGKRDWGIPALLLVDFKFGK